VLIVICARCLKGPCRFDVDNKPIRIAHYFPIADHIRGVFSAKSLAKAAKYAWDRPRNVDEKMEERELTDVWDGAIMDELYHNADPRIDPLQSVYLSLAFDGVEIKKKVFTHTLDM
jgi:hypothetical protein